MKSPSLRGLFLLAFCAGLGGGCPAFLNAGESPVSQLRAAAQVDGEGIFLNQLLNGDETLPALRLGDAPAFGKSILVSRAQVAEWARAAGAEPALTNWSGSEAVRLTRRVRALGEAEALRWLTTVLQQEQVKSKGELELRFSRPWPAVNVPDESLTLKVLDLPTAGVTSAFIVRFELQTARSERIGPWQAGVQAKVWRETWVARSPLKRGELAREADLARERRDVLALREPLANTEAEDPMMEIAEPVQAGSPLLARSLKPRAAVHRGQSAVALLQEGALAITLKVEVLEDGALGQVVRVRNPLSRRDLRGKVIDEQKVLVSL